MDIVRCLVFVAVTAIISDTTLCRPSGEKSRAQLKPWESPCVASGQVDQAVAAAETAIGLFEDSDDIFGDTMPVSLDDYIDEMIQRCEEGVELANDLKGDIMNRKMQSHQVAGSLMGLHLPGFIPVSSEPLESIDEINHVLQLHRVHIQTAAVLMDQLIMDEDDKDVEAKTKKLNEKLLGILCLLEETLIIRTGQVVSRDIVDSVSISQRFSETKSHANRATRAYVFVRDLSESLNVKREMYSQIKSKLSLTKNHS